MRNTEFDYEPDPLGRVGYGVWAARTRRDPFGRLPEDQGEPTTELRRRWSGGERFENDSSIFELGGPVGEDAANDRLDIAKVQIALHNEGRFDLDRSGGPTGYFSPPLAAAIRKRQADHDLAIDGYLQPAGETIESLKALAEERNRDSLSVPLPARPGERPGGDRLGPSADIQLAANPAAAAPAGAAAAGLVRWLVREGARRYAERAAKRAAESLATTEAQVAVQAARSAASVSASSNPAMQSATATGAEASPKQEHVSQDAVRRWLDAGFAGLALPMAGSRGNPRTEKALNITARACKDVLNEMWPEYADVVQHEYGATKDGKGGKNQKELVLKDPNQAGLRGSNRTDSSWRRRDMEPTTKDAYIHLNQGFVLKDGVTPIARERRQLVGLAMKAAAHLVNYIVKPEEGFDQDEYEKYSRAVCIDIFTKALGAPKPETAR